MRAEPLERPVMTNATLDQTADRISPGRTLVLSFVAGFGLLALAGVLLGLRYGPDIFMDALTGLQGCF